MVNVFGHICLQYLWITNVYVKTDIESISDSNTFKPFFLVLHCAHGSSVASLPHTRFSKQYFSRISA